MACRQKDLPLQPGSDLETVRIVMKFDRFADVNDQDTYGNTPIHLAAANGKAQVLEYLLHSFQPQIFIKNNEGKIAYQLASSEETFKVGLPPP